jgi:glycerol-3-phosphate acyltransferase PlsY
MAGDIILVLLVLAIAYLLGSIPSAYIVGRLVRGIDIREIGNGRIGAAAAFRRVGFAGGLTVAFMDLAKGAAAVWLAQGLGLPLPVVLLAGLTVVVGHNWSIFLHFSGGKGALAIYGVLASLMLWQFLIALVFGAVSYFIAHKAGLSTAFVLGSLFFINLFTGSLIWLAIFPVFISVPMILKHIFMSKAGAVKVAPMENLGSKEG